MAGDTRNSFDLFARALEEGGRGAALALLQRGVKPGDVLRDRGTMLGMMPEYFPVFQFLIEQGGDPNTPDKLGETPLTQAALLDQRDFLKLFISLRADIERENRRSETPLIRAAASGHAEICEILISCGADVNRARSKGNWKGYTPLMDAALNRRLDVCGLLISSGADINQANAGGETPLMKAAFEGYADICAMLLESGAETDIRDNAGQDALRHAVKGMLGVAHRSAAPPPRGDYERIIQLLIDKGADMNAQDAEGDTLAAVISRSGDAHAASFLMRLKFRNKVRPQAAAPAAEPDDASGVTPLVSAVAGGDLHEIETLLKQGADINKPSRKFGATPLIWAVIAGNKAVIEFLLRHGADIHAETLEGRNALDYAVQKNDPALVDILMRHPV